jgi:hypothetical protein
MSDARTPTLFRASFCSILPSPLSIIILIPTGRLFTRRAPHVRMCCRARRNSWPFAFVLRLRAEGFLARAVRPLRFVFHRSSVKSMRLLPRLGSWGKDIFAARSAIWSCDRGCVPCVPIATTVGALGNHSTSTIPTRGWRDIKISKRIVERPHLSALWIYANGGRHSETLMRARK